MELIEKVRTLVTEVDKTHRYSMSQIYGMYNEVFGLAEIPQSCASCLIRKVNQLKDWLEKQEQILDVERSTELDKPEVKKRGRKPKQKIE